jgi:CTP:molybdopterin cytidylyltransferase MocA
VVITGLVLAAGAGRRLGEPKAELVVHGERLIDRAVSVLRAGGCDEVVAVVRAGAIAPQSARAVLNPDPDRGMGSSLRCGLAGLTSDACVICLVDQPDLTPADVAAVIAAHREGAQVVVARRGGRRSHPVLVGRVHYAAAADAATGDRGARGFLDGHPELVRWVDLNGELADIDTPADLRRARGQR